MEEIFPVKLIRDMVGEYIKKQRRNVIVEPLDEGRMTRKEIKKGWKIFELEEKEHWIDKESTTLHLEFGSEVTPRFDWSAIKSIDFVFPNQTLTMFDPDFIIGYSSTGYLLRFTSRSPFHNKGGYQINFKKVRIVVKVRPHFEIKKISLRYLNIFQSDIFRDEQNMIEKISRQSPEREKETVERMQMTSEWSHNVQWTPSVDFFERLDKARERNKGTPATCGGLAFNFR